MKKIIKENFLQVGQIVECSNCHPEKGYLDCDLVFKEHGIKCKCICHKQNNWCKGHTRDYDKSTTFGIKGECYMCEREKLESEADKWQQTVQVYVKEERQKVLMEAETMIAYAVDDDKVGTEERIKNIFKILKDE